MKRRRSSSVIVVCYVLGLAVWTACVGEDPIAPGGAQGTSGTSGASGTNQGAQDQPCFPNATCLNSQLACIDGICRIVPGGASGGTNGGIDGGIDGSSSPNDGGIPSSSSSSSTGGASSSSSSSSSSSTGGTSSSSGTVGCTAFGDGGPTCGVAGGYCPKGETCCGQGGTSSSCTNLPCSGATWQCENDSQCPSSLPFCCITAPSASGTSACAGATLQAATSKCVQNDQFCNQTNDYRTCNLATGCAKTCGPRAVKTVMQTTTVVDLCY